MRSILLSFAHPDDESVFAAGVSCLCADRGVRVALVTATRGEAGKAGEPPVCERDQLGAVRERELRTAAQLVGISEIHLLDYRDRELAGAAPDPIRERLVGLVRSVRPDIVITFDPNGTNLHTDHVAISRFTMDAVAAAADPRWFADRGEPHRVRRMLWIPRRPWEALRSGRPGLVAGVDFAIDIAAASERKRAALAAHRSQHLSMERIFFNHADQALTLGWELFRHGWGPPLSARPASNLFEGMG